MERRAVMMRYVTGVGVAAGLSFAAAGVGATPLDALVSSSGKVALRVGNETVATAEPGLHENGWRGGMFSGMELHDAPAGKHGRLMARPVNEAALENWKAFSRNFLTHRNPYTGLT
jgi:hypothetical protein